MDFLNLPDDISRDELTNIISVSTKCNNTRRGMGYEFFKSMLQNRHKVAQKDLSPETTDTGKVRRILNDMHIFGRDEYIAETGEADTYGSLLKRSVRAALHLKSRNLSDSDVVCLCSYNHIHSTVPFLASLFLGIKVASLDPTFTVIDATHLIKLVKPRIFFIVPEVIDMIMTSIKTAGIETEIVVYGDNVNIEKYTPFNTFLEQHQEEDDFSPVDIEDVSETAIIYFSSGTTGLPKGICSSHKAIYHQGFLVEYLGILGPNAVILLYSTLYWVSAVLNLTACIFTGSARLVCQKYEPDKLWILLEKYKVTYCFFAPIQAYHMISVGRPEGIDTSQLYVVVTGGAHFSKEKMNEIRDLLPGTFISQGYGCTEVAGIATFFNLSKTKDKLLLHYRPLSCGRPVPGFQYRIVDPETNNNCGPNERGELRIKSEFVLTGYYNQDSSATFDSEGWLRTGDVVYYDEDFCIYIVDRIKEMLKYRSWHVPPAMLEQVLQSHPAVNRCVVIGIPHDIDGDHPMALIVLNKNYTENVTAEEIESFVAERVNDTHRLRGGVKFIKKMPITPSGKVKKRELKDMVLKGVI